VRDIRQKANSEVLREEKNTLRQEVRKLVRRVPRNNQKGFTLIELLVVISILGILAAIVTVSLTGITAVAQKRAADTEQRTVQAAMDAMLADQGVDSAAACPGGSGPTNHMNSFPTSNGFVQHGGTGGQNGFDPHPTVSLYPQYLRVQDTHGSYTCSNNGVITQTDYKP
jgi:prepilin-type N-terminal cleavage/methylation domain-containing protein